MRDILFRGKDGNGVWRTGFYCNLNDGESYRIYTGYAETDCGEYYPDCYEVDPDTVGEAVMKDKHGKMIFEGDIISAPFTDYSLSGGSRTEYVLGEVYYNNLGWCVDFPESDIVSLEEFHYWDIEAVGNIYDNPEMLEQKI